MFVTAHLNNVSSKAEQIFFPRYATVVKTIGILICLFIDVYQIAECDKPSLLFPSPVT
jgi:hypothetical protein